jgi:tetratricopeptide (TPR) repeat protein
MHRRVALRFGLCALGIAGAMLGAFARAQDPLPPPDALYRAMVRGDALAAASGYVALGDLATGYGLLRAVPAPSDATLRRRAALAEQLGFESAALRDVELLVARTPLDPAVFKRAGVLSARRATRDEAITHLARALQLGDATVAPLLATLRDNTEPLALDYEVASTLAEMGEYRAAERRFLEASVWPPVTAESLASVGLMRALQGLGYEAWLAEASAYAPRSAEVYVLSGLAHRAAGRPFESLEALIGALNLTPLDAEVNAQVSQAYALLGDQTSAAFWASQAQALAPDDPRYADAYATAQANLPTTIPPTP